ncbi:hypothetical protein GCM10010247_08840 [Streptomyces calvus]|nr:hypothetical protein GCM10010247_08840 [Streptomyces calvus]
MYRSQLPPPPHPPPPQDDPPPQDEPPSEDDPQAVPAPPPPPAHQLPSPLPEPERLRAGRRPALRDAPTTTATNNAKSTTRMMPKVMAPSSFPP